jgi:hypothetical protein
LPPDEFHYTPKHASWLNMVEIEIGVLRGQCLVRIAAESESIAEENESVFCSVNLPQRDVGFRLVSAALAQNARPATARARSNPDRMPAADR